VLGVAKKVGLGSQWGAGGDGEFGCGGVRGWRGLVRGQGVRGVRGCVDRVAGVGQVIGVDFLGGGLGLCELFKWSGR